jgi:Ca2+-binding RTX toxin-like protein
MTTLVAGDVAVDMTTWAFTPGWRGTSHSDTEFVIEQESTGKVDTFHGSGFGGFDQFGFPTTGVINGIDFEEDGVFLVSLADFSMTVEVQRAFASAQDMAGWQATIFSGDDHFTGSGEDDHLLGFNGNDVFDLTGGGDDTAEGDAGDDHFILGGEFGAEDTIDGGSGFDRLSLDGNYHDEVVFNAATIAGIEIIDGAEGHDYNLTLDDANVVSFLTGDFTALGVGDNLTFNGAAETGASFHVTSGLGNDTILGGAGSDVLDGGPSGNDTLNGGGGNDILFSHGGTTDMTGGGGNDTFIVDGGEGFVDVVAGGAMTDVIAAEADIVIRDTSGHELLDMRGATGGAVVDMRTGGHVAGRTLIIGTGEGGEPPDDLDLVFSQDLTGSFGDDLENVRAFLPDIFDAVLGAVPGAEFGVTSFRDKGEPSYQTDLGLTADTGAVQTAYDALVATGGGDTPEDQLEALQQLGLRGEEVGWNPGALHVVVMFTDAAFHIAGEGPPTPNDGDEDLEDEDYPTIAQVRDALLSQDVVPIFAVTSNVLSTYESLIDQLGFGAVIELAGDSSNIVDAVNSALDLAVNSTLIEDAEGTQFDDTITGNNAANQISGNAGDDTIAGGGGVDTLRGSQGRDQIYGGDGDDRIVGGDGRDYLDGGAGADVFKFFDDLGEVRATDVIDGFNANEDKIATGFKVTELEHKIKGSGDIDDLASELGAFHAAVVLQEIGETGRKAYIVIDANGETGLQGGEDIVIRLKHPQALGHLDIGDFL